MLVILLTSLIGYFVNKKLTGYGYRHREEEGELSLIHISLLWSAWGLAVFYAWSFPDLPLWLIASLRSSHRSGAGWQEF